ncbi:MAG: AbgT family transporter [Planctomycetota bacterium]|jgi:aminobenzoyl-glutamate transport protein
MSDQDQAGASQEQPTESGWLDRIERVGNALPDPGTLFVLLTVVAFVASWLVAASGHVSVLEIDGRDPITAQAVNLMSADGFRWLFTNLIDIFMEFAPLGLVLTAAIGISIADRGGLIAAGLKLILLVVPSRLLTPATFFAGVMSSAAVDAGYIVLPPLAAAVYRAVGRSPMVGLAAVFAGVACGFNANLVITGIDPMIAGITEEGAQLLDPDYFVNPGANWWFMIVSTLMVTLVGWAITSYLVEPRLAKKAPEDGGPGQLEGAPAGDLDSLELTSSEKRGLMAAFVTGLLTVGGLAAAIFMPGGFLYDAPDANLPFPTWIANIVPLIVVLFVVPGLVYGVTVGTIRSDRDVIKMMTGYMEALGNYIVLAFFASIFVEAFKYSELGRMMAIEGGTILRASGLGSTPLMVAFIVLIAFLNLFVGSMSAKWTMLAPIFVPMLMVSGVSPELTQVSYRIGDSVTNCITPLNSYLIIVLAYMQQFAPRARMGSLIAMMLPYSIVLFIAWSIMLAIWIQLGLPLGIEGALEYMVEGN